MMNLEQSIMWLTSETEKLKKAAVPEIKKIRVYQKYLSWMKECLRWRLFYSEVRRELELTEPKSKEELLKFLEEEYEEWRLNEFTD